MISRRNDQVTESNAHAMSILSNRHGNFLGEEV
jgi:hypothetical protein